MTQKYLATLRVVFTAEDEVEAQLIGNEMAETLDTKVLEDDDTVDVTQIIPSIVRSTHIEPTELVNQLNTCRDMLIKTRIVQCFEEAKELDKLAWVLEHRGEETFDLTGYDYTAFFEHADVILGRK
jgi:hypothetical protein